VPALDRRLQVLEQPGVLAVPLAAVAGQLEKVELVCDRDLAREVGQEDEARLQRRDEEGVLALVVAGDLGAELSDACGDLRGGEVDLSDTRIRLQLASVSLYRWARRSMSRL
jgi:hypothetical protein